MFPFIAGELLKIVAVSTWRDSVGRFCNQLEVHPHESHDATVVGVVDVQMILAKARAGGPGKRIERAGYRQFAYPPAALDQTGLWSPTEKGKEDAPRNRKENEFSLVFSSRRGAWYFLYDQQYDILQNGPALTRT